MVKPLVAVSAGASLGAIIHCSLGRWLNAAYPLVPLGTLAAHVLGGYCIGLALSLFACMPVLGPEWRLLIVTGFLGALTTFSTFPPKSGYCCSSIGFLGNGGHRHTRLRFTGRVVSWHGNLRVAQACYTRSMTMVDTRSPFTRK